MQTSAYTVAYAPERAQYCVERADGLRIYPMPQVWSDPDAAKRARRLCEELNRMEGTPGPCVKPEPTPDIPPDYCASCDLAVYATRANACPECGAQVAEGTAI